MINVQPAKFLNLENLGYIYGITIYSGIDAMDALVMKDIVILPLQHKQQLPPLKTKTTHTC